MSRGEFQLPPTQPRVVFLPGIMGSVLLRSEPVPLLEPRVIWGTPKMLFWRARPANWQSLLLRGNGMNRHGAVATDVPPSESDFGLVQIPTATPYNRFLKRLQLEANADLLVSPYDWRLSNDVSALDLEAAIQARWFRNGVPPEVPDSQRVTVIAHSMGGLVARAFIEGRGGHRVVKQLITGGTPHQGAPAAFTNLSGLTTPLPGAVMPQALQLVMSRFCTSVMQLLPEYDFVVLKGGALEPRATTYTSRLSPHAPSGMSVPDVIRLLRDRFQPIAPWASLNAFLAAKGVTYHCIGSSGLPTPTAWDAFTGFIHTPPEGDKTVPFISAMCPEGPVRLGGGVCSGASNIRQYSFRHVDHQEMFENRGVQDRCLILLGVTPAAPEIEDELELALTGRSGPPFEGEGFSPNLVATVKHAITNLDQLRPGWRGRTPAVRGTFLHAAVRKLLNQAAPGAGWQVQVDRPLRTWGVLPAGTAQLTVNQWFQRGMGPPELRSSLPGRMLSSRIGDLKPDLAIISPDGNRTVWDLTSREKAQHLAKTLLYTHLLAKDNQLHQIGETHWLKL